MDVQTLLNDEIVTELEKVKELELGSDKHKAAVDSLTKLIDRTVEMEKVCIENETKCKQMDDERKDRIVKNVISGVGVVGGMALTVWGTCKSIKFEETGSFTTIMGRGFINKLLPKK